MTTVGSSEQSVSTRISNNEQANFNNLSNQQSNGQPNSDQTTYQVIRRRRDRRAAANPIDNTTNIINSRATDELFIFHPFAPLVEWFESESNLSINQLFFALSFFFYAYILTQPFNAIKHRGLFARSAGHFAIIAPGRYDQSIVESVLVAVLIMVLAASIVAMNLVAGFETQPVAGQSNDQSNNQSTSQSRQSNSRSSSNRSREIAVMNRVNSQSINQSSNLSFEERRAIARQQLEEQNILNIQLNDRSDRFWLLLVALGALYFSFWVMRYWATIKWPAYQFGNLLFKR